MSADITTGVGEPRAERAPSAAQRARREFFPRGLAQPAGGFRFAADTLLLAAFAAGRLPGGRRPLSGLDIGAGCGAASFGLLLLRPERELRLTGLDVDPAMLACARENAAALGLGGRFATLSVDAADYRGSACDFILLNPPFRTPGSGRACPNPERSRARFEGPGGFDSFAACAARNLRTRGRLFLVHLAERLPSVFAALLARNLAPKLLLPVQGRAERPPRLVLICAAQNGGPGLKMFAPLTLYDAAGRLTPEALAFCPHLAANARRAVDSAAPTLANVQEQG